MSKTKNNRLNRLQSKLSKKLKAKYDKFHSKPETHPRYRIEWKKFWLKRTSELEKAGINYDSYDFEGEWKEHIAGKFNEFKASEFKEKQLQIRRSSCNRNHKF
jgi:hypothetical protein